ncbi:PREDICTED: protein chibby homolog 1-like [Nicrophorus vespilloides]|uniref:Protein chibby homolog 1-like n=1 Tax=Nicrophorus vespilloides TaxID=110193 RepID=A0ABM1MJ68_NICVS|nr:PREDICTED: protein chibby homolog 1-like [Nicrophorus vespilloides]
MPLFGSKFLPKRAPSRKSLSSESVEDLYGENHRISLRLGQQECVFDNGEWVPENGTTGSLHKTSQKLRSRIQQLEEENNMLKVKFELLLNMLTETTAECHLQQREITKLQKNSKLNK